METAGTGQAAAGPDVYPAPQGPAGRGSVARRERRDMAVLADGWSWEKKPRCWTWSCGAKGPSYTCGNAVHELEEPVSGGRAVAPDGVGYVPDPTGPGRSRERIMSMARIGGLQPHGEMVMEAVFAASRRHSWSGNLRRATCTVIHQCRRVSGAVLHGAASRLLAQGGGADLSAPRRIRL